MGSKQSYRLVVTEPEPGRVLAEADATAGTATRFVLEPVDGQQTKVTIITDARAATGVRGFMERLVNPPLMRRIYAEELQLLDEVVRRGRQ
jgi:hypothetical protein